MTYEEQVAMVVRWTDLAGEMLAQGVPPANIKWAIERWGEKADALYPMVEEGEAVSLTEEDLDGSLAKLPEGLRQDFLATTVITLFEGQDGPRTTALALKDAVDKLNADIERQERTTDA